MQVSRDIAGRSSTMIANCGLDTLSIFIRNHHAAKGDGDLSYLYHHDISAEAQEAYQAGRVYEDDPFTHALAGSERSGALIRWGDDRLSSLAGRAHEYRSFISSYGVEVVGAWVQQIMPGFHLVIGAHCKPGGHRAKNVTMDRLDYEMSGIAQMVLGELFENLVLQTGGICALQNLLQPCQASAQDIMARLSPREQEVARHVGEGMQNKQIAYQIGISEFTVENHLRRIYRKLEVNNRTAMAARLLERPTWQ